VRDGNVLTPTDAPEGPGALSVVGPAPADPHGPGSAARATDAQQGGLPPTESPGAPRPREFSEDARKRIEWLYTRYPVKEAALLPVLRVAEEEFGAIDGPAILCVAKQMGLSPGHVLGVFTFYTHYRRAGDGKYVLQVCSTISCALRGARDIVHHLEGRYGLQPGQTTPDGRFTLKKVECLASCDTAPVVQINDDYHEGLTIEKLDAILDSLP
jgi:NADH-quinone oxidoreductase subunit E